MIAPSVPNSAIDATAAANQAFLAGFEHGQLSCASTQANPSNCLPRVGLTAVPDGTLRMPYFLQWSLALEQQLGNTGSLRVQYVGTRAVDLPYQVQVNGYQTVCNGCFAPFPYAQPEDPRFGTVTQLETGANSHYNGLQLTGVKRVRHGLQLNANYTWSHCLDTISNGGFLSFSSAGILSPLPNDLRRQYGDCDYDIRHNFNASYVYELPLRSNTRWLNHLVGGWQVSGTAFWHTGVPFTVLSAPYTANGNGILQGGGPQFASVVTGVPLYTTRPVAGVTQPGTVQWLNPNAFVSTVRSQHRRMRWRRHPGPLPVRRPWTQYATRPMVHLERSVSHQESSTHRARVLADRRAILQRLQSPELRIAVSSGGNPRPSRNTNRLRIHQPHHVAAHRPPRCGLGRRQFPAHDRPADAPGVLNRCQFRSHEHVLGPNATHPAKTQLPHAASTSDQFPSSTRPEHAGPHWQDQRDFRAVSFQPHETSSSGSASGARQDVFMTVELHAVEATCRSLMGNAYLLESQFLYDAPARLVSVEVPDADCLRAKMAERVTNSCVCSLRSHALPCVPRRHPVSSLVDVWHIGKIQCGSDDEIPVEPMESSQCDSCLTLVIHRSSNGVLQRLP